MQFVASPSLDMMNAMYFTGHLTQSEGVEGWPAELRRQMAPDLLAELDFMFEYPAGDPGVMGILATISSSIPRLWRDVDALIAYVESMPHGIGELDRGTRHSGADLPGDFPLPG